MSFNSKVKRNRVLCILAILSLSTFFVFMDFQHSNMVLDQLDKPKLSEAPLYHLEWSQIDTSLGGARDLAMSSSEDIYMVCDGPGYGQSTVIKYNSIGTFQWETSRTGEFGSIALDSSNNVYIAGYTAGYDMILEKFSSSGVFQWSRTYSVRDYDQAFAVTVDSSNNVYIGGISYLSGSWVNKDALLVKYSSSGTRLWERFLDLRDEDYIKGLTTDSSNNIYLTGHHRLYSTTDDVFIAKYSSSGTFQWSQNWGSVYDEEAYDITLDSANNIYVTGMADDPTTHEDLLLLKFNSAGNLQWSREWAGSGLDRGYSIELYSDGDIFIGGATYEESAGLFDILLAVYDSTGTMRWWGRWGGSNHDTGRGIAVNPSKQVYLGGDRNDDLCLLKYDLAPTITINSPTPYSLCSFTAPAFDVDIADSNLIGKYYTVNDGSQISFSGSTGTINQAQWDSCSHGLVSLKFYGEDTSGAVYEEVIVEKDILAPDFDIISPNTYQVCTDIAPTYQLSTSDTDINAMWYTLNGGGDIGFSSFSGQIDQTAWNLLDNGSVSIEFFMEDNIGNVASEIVEVYKNYEIPLIFINSPTPNQLCGLIAPIYSITPSSLWTIDQMWYSLNNGNNITITNSEGIINQLEWDLYGNGTVNINFYANNSLGNVGNAEVIVRKDIYYPFIEIYSPIESYKYGISAPNYNVSITSVTLDSKWYSFNYGYNIQFFDDVGEFNQNTWSMCGNGSVTVTFYANNTDGIINSKEILIFKDIRCPNITILTPIANTLYGLESIGFSLSIDDPQLDQTWYSLNGGINYTFSGIIGTITQAAWESCGNGTVSIKFYANNTLGNIGFAEVKVRKDVYFPFITIISPEPEQWCGISAPTYNISVSTLDIDSMWYTLNGGTNFPILTTFGELDQTYWDSFGNENVTITFYVNNSYGQLNFKSVEVRKDINTPMITIISPLAFEIFGIETIKFNVTITDPSIDSKWYTLNGGSKCFFTVNEGYIDQTEWEACGNGTVTITFFANNSLGNLASEQVIVHRDIYFPFIEIHEPINYQLIGPYAPNYNISISSYAIDQMWYILNSNVKDTIISQVGMINQSSWDMFGPGFITISFYANNTYGQVNFQEIIVEKATTLIERNAYAIIIGISDYPGTSSDLNYCDDDASAVYNMLVNDYNFKPSNIIMLSNAEATKNGITNAFNQIQSIIQPNDIFYFYYSGHGGSEIVTSSPSTLYINSPHPYPNYYDRTWWIGSTNAAYIRLHFETINLESGYDYLYLGDALIEYGYYYQEITGSYSDYWSDWIPVSNDNRIYLRLITDYMVTLWGFRVDQIQAMRYEDPNYLCSYDSIPSTPSNYYLDTLIDQQLDNLNCQNKYLVIDACNSGGIISETQDTDRFIITACKSGQVSYEDGYLDHGVFTYNLLNSFDYANDQNGDGVLSMEECFSYTYSTTVSYTDDYGPGYACHPQKYDGIAGEAVLYPAIGSIILNPVGNQLAYSFNMYGHGKINVLNMTVCTVFPDYQFKTLNLKDMIITPTGFGYYSGIVEFDPGYIPHGVEIYAEIEGYQTIVIDLTYGDYDGDGLDDFFEILHGNGLSPYLNDTDSDGLNDYDEFYGDTDPLDSDTDDDGLLDGEEINIYGTNPLNDDTDTDGLSDGEEINIYGTNPLNDDTDTDGLTDGNEIIIHLTNPLNNDTDSDDLSDGDEVNIYGTNPLDEDTDSDGINDYDEIFVYNTNPFSEDTDDDDLNDIDEIFTYGTDPLLNDTDSDLMTDGYEVVYGLDPLVDDSTLDPDNDLLNNLEEFNYLTDPFINDTDTDDLLDGEEVYTYGTSPTNSDSDSDGLLDGEEVLIHETEPLIPDTDGDGLSDGDEVNVYGTDPLDGDTDSDTMPDEWEVLNFTDPLLNDTLSDPDSDNLLNIEEYTLNCDPQDPDTDDDTWLDGDEVHIYGTDPLDPNSHPNPPPPGIPGYELIILLNLSVTVIGVISWRLFKQKKIS